MLQLHSNSRKRQNRYTCIRDRLHSWNKSNKIFTVTYKSACIFKTDDVFIFIPHYFRQMEGSVLTMLKWLTDTLNRNSQDSLEYTTNYNNTTKT